MWDPSKLDLHRNLGSCPSKRTFMTSPEEYWLVSHLAIASQRLRPTCSECGEVGHTARLSRHHVATAPGEEYSIIRSLYLWIRTVAVCQICRYHLMFLYVDDNFSTPPTVPLSWRLVLDAACCTSELTCTADIQSNFLKQPLMPFNWSFLRSFGRRMNFIYLVTLNMSKFVKFLKSVFSGAVPWKFPPINTLSSDHLNTKIYRFRWKHGWFSCQNLKGIEK